MMNPIDVITASAGTGKTYRLVQEATTALDTGLLPERLMAVTFTNRAAAELVQRMRAHLLANGRPRDAERLLGGRIGTVHAVFGDLLREFALEAGRSPVLEVIAENTASRLFATSADEAIAKHATLMEELAARFSFGAGRKKLDWREKVMAVALAARTNGINAEDLPAGGAKSWEALRALLSPADPAGPAALDRALAAAVDQALATLKGKVDSKKTGEVVEVMAEAASILHRNPGDLPWATWAKLTNLAPGKPAIPAVTPVIEAASAHLRHPRLAADLEAFTTGLFRCASEAAVAYQRWKEQRGVADFADQEATALELLRMPSVMDTLRERVGRVLVDEFQDTSPIQLALFLRMAAVADHSVWVGDPKQAIYGFRGTDPELMASVVARLPDTTGGSRSTLDTSRRSRPGLVSFFDDVFVPAFEALGLPCDQVALGSADRDDALRQQCALAVMPLQVANQEQEARAIAAGVVAMIRDAGSWTVRPRGEEGARPVRPGDIAILCRRNDRCEAVAEALEALGVQAAIGRSGLLNSAEVVVAIAALRWAVDGRDRLALAEIAHLVVGAPDEWFRAALSAEREELEKLVPAAGRLRAVRARLLHLTPSEALDASIEAADVTRYAASLGDVETRLANLEALRALAIEYQEECASLEAPATAGGLAAWLIGQEDAERPPNPDHNAVQVMTCHGSKGLEWPVVILSDLGEPPEPRIFDQVVAEQGDCAADADAPLAGRWLRYWPWPYGASSKVALKDAAASSPAGLAAASRASSETVRLLYVAMTRARDYLVLAPRLDTKGNYKVGWLDRLVGPDGTGIVTLPASGESTIRVGSSVHEIRVLAPVAPPEKESTTELIYWSPGAPGPVDIHLPLRVRPSAANISEGPVLYDVSELGPRLRLVGSPDMQNLGEAFHSFFAVDGSAEAPHARLEKATSCLKAWSVAGAIAAEDLVESADRLWLWCSERLPGAIFEREVPVTGRRGLQRISGRIDLLVRSPEGVHLVDHKAFPGTRDTWAEKVIAVAPQLELYREVCEAAGEKVTAKCIHLPIAGVMLTLHK
jgi:ATP-dependent helicase/nuclease subunit A